MKVDRSISLAVLLACASIASGARAYSSPDAYIELPTKGGGGGRWFSGSPADGFSCAVCHSADGQRSFPLYVTGLPLEGYTVQEAREVVISWPEFSQRWREIKPDPMAPLLPGAPVPAMGMTAEFVAESGKASGVIEIRGGTATPAEQCEITRPNLQPRLGVRLYQVRPGVPAFQVKPDDTGTLRCEARHLGQRCIIALQSCGAQQTRFIWTPPATQEGAIWFSAGFVTSDQLTGTPENDGVYELSVPVVQGGSGTSRYQETLRGACAVSSPGASHASAGWLACLALTFGWLARRATRRRPFKIALLVLGLVLGFVLGLASCAEHEPLAPASFPSTGLYTPGSTLGASDPTDVPMVIRSNNCVSLPPVPGAIDGGVVGTAGTLTVEYSTQTIDGFFAPKNCTAVWIETMGGAYVATIEVRAALRRPGLVYWQERACTDPDALGPDVTTSATLRTHDAKHELEWTGLDFEGKGVPDGTYKLHIEITETDKEPGELNVVEIVKGPAPFTMPLPVPLNGYLKEGSVTWTVQ